MDSFADLSASPVQGTYNHVNILSDLVHPTDGTEYASGKAELPTLHPTPPYLSSRVWEEYGDPADDPLFKSLQSMPSPQEIHQSTPQSSEIMSFFNLDPGSSDAETGSKVSSESSSSADPLQSFPLQPDLQPTYEERKHISILEVCNRTEILPEVPLNLGKRKRARGAPSQLYSSTNPSKKKRKVTQPSKFCHICVRSCDQVKMVPCAKVADGHCRKNVCKRCFERYGIDHEWITAIHNLDLIPRVQRGELPNMPDGSWTCLHCRKMCPRNAQCTIYQRTNKRRHDSLQQRRFQKLERERDMARRAQAAQYQETRVKHAVEGLISPTDLPNLPIPVTLPADIISDSDRFFQSGILQATDDLPLPPLNIASLTRHL